MGFELRDHTADVAVAATGDSLEAVFEATADGLAAASSDDIPPETGERFSLTVTAERREALLFDYLGELIYLRDVRAELPVDNRVESIDAPADGSDDDADATAWSLEASARGVPLAAVDAREVKAVTYSEMRLESVADGWEAYVVFDV
ncbi:archease [Natrinema thermotolerans]|uniref:Archease n=1 Tax=Natrinema thermotolerans TaxID=121872 RepID=A0AAF0T3P0_9EURY|nr:archease [Natrinema thermotolerans]QCC60389.1 archease [Natrinema thermotolerans]QCC61296.1 archease [Natrinema thermotolerans]WMT10213.1 archease [Natrinema thermotolerans]WMT10233.1 archease [Natrinema thermotolerans]